MIKIIRFPIAVLGAIVAFILGYGAWLFTLGLGPAMLLIHCTYWPLVYFGVFKDDEIDYSEAMFHLIGFLLAYSTFKSIMDGEFPS